MECRQGAITDFQAMRRMGMPTKNMSLTNTSDNNTKRGSLSRMSRSPSKFLVFAAALALSSCSYTNSVIDWATGSAPDTDSGDQDVNADVPSPSTPNSPVPIAPSAAESNPQPTLT